MARGEVTRLQRLVPQQELFTLTFVVHWTFSTIMYHCLKPFGWQREDAILCKTKVSVKAKSFLLRTLEQLGC